MNCAKHEMDLFMMAHGETTGISKLKVLFHLARCGGCRNRLKKIYSLSSSLATNLANPRLGVRPLNRPIQFGRVGLVLVVLGILVAILSALIVRQGAINRANGGGSNQNCSVKGRANLDVRIKLHSNFPIPSCD